MTPYKISYQWLPIVDKHRYRPLPVSVDFLQNVFDILFLLIFIWYWNWGPLLVVLYYVIETVVMCIFTSLKWWKSKAKLSEDQTLSTPTFKAIAILSLCLVIGVFSYGQITAVHNVLGMVMSLPSWDVILSDEKQFLLGVLAIVLQQTSEYYKYNLIARNTEVELVTAILTPVLRIFVQQFSVMLGICAVLIVSFVDLKSASVMIALMLGLIKIIFGQLQLVVKK
ncbi:MAG: hypothetical protein JWM14_814 [Chitinophagaceae bacterium]|nr:hypothetical protein [Chitinophagaceae bacterium]